MVIPLATEREGLSICLVRLTISILPHSRTYGNALKIIWNQPGKRVRIGTVILGAILFKRSPDNLAGGLTCFVQHIAFIRSL